MENFEPGTHLVLAVLGVLIFELNKAAASPSSVNIATCNKQLSIARDYVKSKEDFRTSLEAFPTKFIQEEQGKLQKIASQKETSAADYDVIAATIGAVGNFEKFMAVIVNLVTMSKEEGEKTSTASALHWSAMSDLKWEAIKTGTHALLFLSKSVYSCVTPPSGCIIPSRIEYLEPIIRLPNVNARNLSLRVQ